VVALTQCKDCNFKIENKCWYYGDMTPPQLSKKAILGCEKYRPWWMMHPPIPCNPFQSPDRLMSESVTNENGELISGRLREHGTLARCMSLLFHDNE